MKTKLYMDATQTPLTRAKDLLAQMSWEEKLGQLQGYNPAFWSQDDLEKDYPHGAGAVSCLVAAEYDTADEVANKIEDIQRRIITLSEHNIPALFHIETLCGVMMPEAQSFPSGIGQGSTWNPVLQKRMARIIGNQTSAMGIRQAFAPVLDISRDSRFGRQGETYGEDPALASAMGIAYVQGVQNDGKLTEGVYACAKHFLAYHASQGGIHAAESYVSPRVLREIYAKPFQAAITQGGMRSLMNCYSEINGEPVAGSTELLRGLLRQEMGFIGVVVADFGSISEMHTRQKVCANFLEAGIRSLKAGMDIELPSKLCYSEEMLEHFKSGKLDQSILDEAVLRILVSKYELGIFENPFPADVSERKRIFSLSNNHDTSLEVAKQSLVLLKNEGVLPLSAGTKKIALIGHHAASTRALFGGYSFMSMTESALGAGNTMAGVEMKSADTKNRTYKGSNVDVESPLMEETAKRFYPNARNLLEQLTKKLPDVEITYSHGYDYAGEDESGFGEALAVAAEADVVILTLGGKYGWGTASTTAEGVDSTDINLPRCQERFIRELAQLNKPAVGIHFDGRPISSDAADEHLAAIVEAWNPGETGAEAIVALLLGEYSPAGRLPVSVAYTSGQIPLYYNHHNGSSWHVNTISAFTSYVDRPHEPRYCFGHGLSYSQFDYSNLTISKDVVAPDESVQIAFDLSNTGNHDSDEVVQLYISDYYASMARPVQELAGFSRVSLKKGESKRISFSLDPSQIALLDENMRWKVEAGDIDVRIGSSSEDIRLTGRFAIKEDLLVNGRKRAMVSEVQVADM